MALALIVNWPYSVAPGTCASPRPRTQVWGTCTQALGRGRWLREPRPPPGAAAARGSGRAACRSLSDSVAAPSPAC